MRALTQLLRALAALTAVALLPALSAANAQALSLEHDGRVRHYLLHVPEGVSGKAPLVLALHGRGGDGEQMARLTGLAEAADRFGFIAAFPSGLGGEWNYVAGVRGYELETDDVGFLRALAHSLAEEQPVDPARIYVAGFSNGGFMAQLLACEAADVFAAFASVAAAGFGGQPGVCGEQLPTSLLLIHGTHDAVIPWDGLRQRTPSGPVTLLASVEQTVAFWAERLGCGTRAERSVLPASGSSETETHVIDMLGCPEGVALRLVAVVGGGHNWPGHPGELDPRVAGNVSTDFDASELIWRFFERNALE